MGYDLRITRAENWSDNGGCEISIEEWMVIVRNDPEFTPAAEKGPYFAHWNGGSSHVEPWLDWYDGNIYSKDPDPPLIAKMVQIARILDARVQGDDGEFYAEDGSVVNEDASPASPKVQIEAQAVPPPYGRTVLTPRTAAIRIVLTLLQ